MPHMLALAMWLQTSAGLHVGATVVRRCQFTVDPVRSEVATTCAPSALRTLRVTRTVDAGNPGGLVITLDF